MNIKLIGFDFETSGKLPEYALQPWRVATGDAWATSLAVVKADADASMAVSGGLNPTVDDMRAFLEDAIATRSYVVGWNTIFDIAWLLAYGLHDLVHQVKWLDGMLLWRHCMVEPEYEMVRGKRKSYSLKTGVSEYLPQFAGYEAEVDFHDTSPEARSKLHKYNILDTTFTVILTQHWLQALQRSPAQLRAALIEAECLPMIAQANLEGMCVDVEAAKNLQAKLADTAAVALAELEQHGATEKILKSPAQLAELMFDVWGLKSAKKTAAGARATDKEALHDLAEKDPRAKLIRTYRDAIGTSTKFAETPLKSVEYNGDGRTRPAARIFGTYSGRLTYDSSQGRNKDKRQIGFALHQQKRGAEFRDIIRAPDGYTLVEFDASGQEFRWMAIASGDETMLHVCRPGEDPHSFMAARIAGWDYADLMEGVAAKDSEASRLRQLGKVANLSLQYRTSAKRLRAVARVNYGIDLTEKDAVHMHATYRQTYSAVPEYWASQIALAQMRKYVDTLAGRRVQIEGDWSGSLGWSMESTAINYRIQGTGADQKYLALATLRPYLRKIEAKFAWDLHDGIYFYIPNAHVEAALPTIVSTLNNLPYHKMWGINPPIPLPWDCKVGKSWGQLKERKFI